MESKGPPSGSRGWAGLSDVGRDDRPRCSQPVAPGRGSILTIRTQPVHAFQPTYPYFNPRTHKGTTMSLVRDRLADLLRVSTHVSTHVSTNEPMMGATQCFNKVSSRRFPVQGR